MMFLSIEDVHQYLDDIPRFQSHHAGAIDLDLSKFRAFCAEIGNPQDDFPAIHVAGTNGKGSTCRILESIYREAGYETGLYTSPHILKFNERFVVGGQPLPDDAMLAFFRDYHRLMEAHKLTYFEISTALAFWWFSKSEVDLGIIETGLGGRLDATNVVRPAASIITSISLDHTEILGGTLQKIAREKGGIIKPGRPVVIGNLPPEAETTILRIAKQNGSPVMSIEELHPELTPDSTVKLQVNGKKLSVKTPFNAPVQALNTAIAWEAVHVLSDRFPVSEAQFAQGLQHMDIGYGRFEKLSSEKQWYFDGAHNIEAVKAVKQSVAAAGDLDEAILVLSLMGDKIRPDLMNEFSEFKNILYYSLNTKRAAPFKEIKKWWPDVKAFPTQSDQQRHLLNEFDSELVIFAGSFYFYATVRDWIKTLF